MTRVKSTGVPSWWTVAALAAAMLHAAPAPAAADDGLRELQAPFVGGRDGHAVYRIPSLVVSNRGTLLAFAEARRGIGDQSQNKLVLRRSSDGGRTWAPVQVVADDRRDSLNNPTAIVLSDGGRVLLMYQRYPAGTNEGSVQEGVTGSRVCQTFLTASADDGHTWSRPRDVTAMVKRPTGATSTACGPGVAIQLRRGKHVGRILVPFNQGPPRNCQVYAAYSDDRGESWRYGAVAPAGGDGRGNEVQMVELSDGRVLLNSRGSSGKRFRKVATSNDGGESWSQLRDDPRLPEPQCQASLIGADGLAPAGATGAKRVILFSNPGVTVGRTHGTVRLSEDDGATWLASRQIVPGDFAYSCLAVLPDQTIGCLYETDHYRRIAFVAFTLDWLRRGAADK